jgi:predicted N-acetyltransferase YhbS
MNFSCQIQGRHEALIELFRSSFATAEGPAEGELIANLARKLLEDTPAVDRLVCIAEEAGAIQGACLFSRLRFPQDGRSVFLLAPVAVASQRQGRGIGQGMLRHGLELLRQQAIEVVLTYGDPNYYHRVGFQPISPTAIPPPLPLQQPQGWLGQTLTGRPLDSIQGPSHCVQALNDPAYW